MFLSIIIPAYNEEKRLPKTLLAIDKYLKEQSYPSASSPNHLGMGQAGQASYEIVVVNDGSKDGTADIVRSFIPKIKNLRLIDNKENRGKGYVTRQGMLEAKGKYRIFTDADNSTSIDQIEKMLPEFKAGFDIIIGSRDIKGAVLDPPQPWLRNAILGNGFKLFRKIVIGLWEISDTQCGFKGMSEKAVQDILPKCLIDRWAFDPEILILAKRSGYKIKEIPVIWKNDPDSKVKFNGMVKMAIDLFKIKLNLIKNRYD